MEALTRDQSGQRWRARGAADRWWTDDAVISSVEKLRVGADQRAFAWILTFETLCVCRVYLFIYCT